MTRDDDEMRIAGIPIKADPKMLKGTARIGSVTYTFDSHECTRCGLPIHSSEPQTECWWCRTYIAGTVPWTDLGLGRNRPTEPRA